MLPAPLRGVLQTAGRSGTMGTCATRRARWRGTLRPRGGNPSPLILQPLRLISMRPILWERNLAMQSSRVGKPLTSAALSLALVLALVLPILSVQFLAGPTTPFDIVQAGSIHWGIVAAIFLAWLGIQLFWPTSTENTKLSMVVSATILWLSLAIFFNFNGQPEWGGPVAFFTLVGGLGVVLAWTRFLADEISFF